MSTGSAEHPPRRWIGLGGAVVGLGIIVTAVLDAADGDPPLVRAALVLVLFVVTIGSARLAMVRQLHVQDALRPHAVTRPNHPVLICNPWSGGGRSSSSVSSNWLTSWAWRP
jgi:hypothetical protein